MMKFGCSKRNWWLFFKRKSLIDHLKIDAYRVQADAFCSFQKISSGLNFRTPNQQQQKEEEKRAISEDVQS